MGVSRRRVRVMDLLKAIIKVPIAVVYAIGMVVLCITAIPFVIAGFITGMAKFAFMFGDRIYARWFGRYLYQ